MADTAQPSVTIYKSSRGDLVISEMAYPHISNAIAKMEREGRTDQPLVLAALCARRDALDAEREAAEVAAPVAEAVIGHNGSPEKTPYEVVKGEIEDLRLEASAWLDVAEIKSQAEADKIGLLRDKVDKAMAQAEKQRVIEKTPFDEGAAEVQTRYNLLIGDNKSVTGVAVKMRKTINVALEAWLKKIDDEQEVARQEAARIERDAREKAEIAIAHTHDTTNIDERDAALRDVDVARQAAFDLAAANRAKPQVQTQVGSRAVSLRTVYDVEVTDAKALAAWFWNCRKDDLITFMTDEARKTVRAMSGNVTINGVKVLTQKVL